MHSYRKELLILRSVAVMLGVLYAFGARYRMYPDTVSYLDMGDAYFRGDFANAVNSHWGAFFSWLLGLTMAVFQPSPKGEVILVHAVTFAVYLCSLVAFEFFLRNVLASMTSADSIPNDTPKGIDRATIALAYAVYVWSAIELVTVSLPTPDLCVSTVVLTAMGCIFRIRAKSDSYKEFAILGAVLGIGYLVKNVMFPLAFVFLTTAWLTYGLRRGLVQRILLSTTVFATIAAILIIPISIKKQRPTFGDSGKLNYAWHVNGVKHYSNWHDDSGLFGTPLHTTRIVHRHPVIYEFTKPVAGTYPPWYDPTYWYEGVQPRINIKQQAANCVRLLRLYAKAFTSEYSFFVGTALVLLAFSLTSDAAQSNSRWRATLTGLHSQWPIFLPSVIALGMYCIVHVELRYVGPFIFLFLMGIICSARLIAHNDLSFRRLALSVAIVMWILLTAGAIREMAHTTDDSEHCRVAEGLWKLGVERGECIGHIGNSFKAYWARFGRFKIGAEIRPEDADTFFSGDTETQSAAIRAFQKCRLQAIVTKNHPGLNHDWTPIPNTHYSVYLFQ